jgi:hypothetical protein
MGMHPEEILRTKRTLTSHNVCVKEERMNPVLANLKQTKASILQTSLRLRRQYFPVSISHPRLI